MKIKSTITRLEYEPDDCVHIVNVLQALKYIKNNAVLLDLQCGNNDRLVFVFDRKDTQHLYNLWCKRELL